MLEFVELIANFSIMLRRHFRGSRLRISFSSETFYAGQLQAVKFRGEPI
jgi:superfamily I DNA and/or RNA helicase